MCIDDSFEGTALQRWFQLVLQAGPHQGRDMLKAIRYKNYLRQAGFENIREETVPITGCPWTRDRRTRKMGYFMGRVFFDVLDSYAKFLSFAGLSSTEINELNRAVRKDLVDPTIHWYLLT